MRRKNKQGDALRRTKKVLPPIFAVAMVLIGKPFIP